MSRGCVCLLSYGSNPGLVKPGKAGMCQGKLVRELMGLPSPAEWMCPLGIPLETKLGTCSLLQYSLRSF